MEDTYTVRYQFNQFRNGCNPWMARYVYGLIFLIVNLLAWAARDYGRGALTEVTKFKNCKGRKNCLGMEGVLRVSLGCFLFYFVMFLSTLGTSKTESLRDRWHSGWRDCPFWCRVNAGYLTPALMGLYIVFICWCAIRSEPAGESCNRKAAASNITDWLTKWMRCSVEMEELHLHGNSIGDERARALMSGLSSHKGKLTLLDLGNNSISAKGAIYIAEYVKRRKILLWLNLYMNDIGDEGAVKVADTLKQNCTIATIDMGGNNIHTDGVNAIAQSLKDNTIITTLELGYNPIGPDGAKALSEVLKFHGNDIYNTSYR